MNWDKSVLALMTLVVLGLWIWQHDAQVLAYAGMSFSALIALMRGDAPVQPNPTVPVPITPVPIQPQAPIPSPPLHP